MRLAFTLGCISVMVWTLAPNNNLLFIPWERNPFKILFIPWKITVSLANSSGGLLNESVATDPQNRSEHCQIKYLRAGFQPGGEPGFNLGKGGDGVRPDPVRIRSSFACGSGRGRRIRHKRHGTCFGPRRGRNRGPESRLGCRARGCSTGGRAGETRRQGQCRNSFPVCILLRSCIAE